MSRMLPQESVDVLRDFVNVSLDNYGIDCTLYIPTNSNDIEKYDVFVKPSDYTYAQYTAKVFIDWSPTIWTLKKYGLFVEDQTPILAYMGNKAIDQDGDETTVNIIIGSYIRINPQFVSNNYKDIEEYEIVNIGTPKIHDAVIVQVYSLAPRRVQV